MKVALYSLSEAACSVVKKQKVTMSYEGNLFSDGPNKEEKNKAMKIAKRRAWEKFVSGFSTAQRVNYDSLKSRILGDLDSYLTLMNRWQKVDEDNDKFTLVIKVCINEAALNSLLNVSSKSGRKQSGEGSYFTFIFVARQVSAEKSYQDKIFRREDSDSLQRNKKDVLMQGDSTSISTSKMKSKSFTSGGSKEKKSDVSRYRLVPTKDIDASINQVFSTAGFEVVNAIDLVEESNGLINLKRIKKDFGTIGELSGKARRNAFKGAKNLKIPYIAIGTLDIDMKRISASSGNTTVWVSVNARVYSLKKRFPKTVASVGPLQRKGAGDSTKVATRQALIAAAKAASQELVNQMNAKDLH
jgi:hypothetical protein